MILGKLILSNFRRFISEEITFDRPLSVLVGRNNSGKTTILEALSILFQISPGPIPISRKIGNLIDAKSYAEVQFIFNENEWNRVTNSVANGYPRYREKLELNSIISQLVSTPINYRWTSNYRGGMYLQGQDSRTIGFANKNIFSNFSDAQVNIISAGLEGLLSINLGKFSGVLHIPSDRYFAKEEKFMPFDNLESLEVSARNQLIRSNLYHLKKVAPSKYDTMVGILKRIIDDISDVDNFLDENTGRLELNFKEGNSISNLFEMGAGVRSLVTLLGGVLSPGTSLALLDEPDINLHPGLVRELILLLREMNNTTQVIISSHNETFINTVDPLDILHVRATDSLQSSVSELEAEKDKMEIINDLGVSIENYKLSEAISGRIIIIGEGKTDWEYLKDFAKKGNMLNRISSLSPVYIPLGGKRLVDADLLDKISGSKTPFLLIRDRDEYSRNEIEKFQETIGTDRIHILQKREIENYLLDYEALHSLINSKLQKKSKNTQLTLSELKSIIMNLAESLKRKLVLLKFVHSMPGLKLLWGDEIHFFIERNLTKDNYDVVNDLSGNILERISTLSRDKLKENIEIQENEVNQVWTEDNILKVCPGKDLLKLIRKWLKDEYDIEIQPYEMIHNLTSLDTDIRNLLQKIINLGSD